MSPGMTSFIFCRLIEPLLYSARRFASIYCYNGRIIHGSSSFRIYMLLGRNCNVIALVQPFGRLDFPLLWSVTAEIASLIIITIETATYILFSYRWRGCGQNPISKLRDRLVSRFRWRNCLGENMAGRFPGSCFFLKPKSLDLRGIFDLRTVCSLSREENIIKSGDNRAWQAAKKVMLMRLEKRQNPQNETRPRPGLQKKKPRVYFARTPLNNGYQNWVYLSQAAWNVDQRWNGDKYHESGFLYLPWWPQNSNLPIQ